VLWSNKLQEEEEEASVQTGVWTMKMKSTPIASGRNCMLNGSKNLQQLSNDEGKKLLQFGPLPICKEGTRGKNH
jgi:hypothetical protein